MELVKNIFFNTCFESKGCIGKVCRTVDVTIDFWDSGNLVITNIIDVVIVVYTRQQKNLSI